MDHAQLEPRTGVVYLICFDRPFKHARHYLGFAYNLEARIARHRSGDGARLLRAVTAAGIGWQVVRTWPDTSREFERKLKNQKATARLCPVCGKAWRDKDAKRKRRARHKLMLVFGAGPHVSLDLGS